MMPAYLCFTVRFLQPYYHGRTDGGEPEWPPSPLRVFQAIVAAAATRWRETQFHEYAASSLHWLERQHAPSIVACVGQPASVKYRLYVPDNVTDKVAKSWVGGREANIADYRTEKDVRPTRLYGEAVHYLFPLSDDGCPHLDVLRTAARSITHLGWGVDMVAGNASIISAEQVAKLPGQRWRPTEGTSVDGCRVPIEGTLQDLIDKYNAFLSRLGPDGFNPVPPLSAYDTVGYRRATDPPVRSIAAFALLKPDASGYRAFDAVHRGVAVAGMMRCAARMAAVGSRPNDDAWINQFILGHAEARGEPYKPVAGPRLAYIPVPSIEAHGEGRTNVIGAIRRVLLTVLPGDVQENIIPSDASGSIRLQNRSDRDEMDWAGRAMSGMDLIPDHAADCVNDPDHPGLQPCKVEWEPTQSQENRQAIATLSRLPATDRMIQRYVRPASVWATVTPIILPGYDDPRHYRRRLKNGVGTDEQRRLLASLSQRIDALIRKAIGQAGFSELLAQNAVIDWRKTGFWPGTDLAGRYVVPRKLKRFSRYHVRIEWRDAAGSPIEVTGPICLGAGRFYGLGLLAAET
jgi:CRISPR-associated protein Csb2